MAGDTLTHDTDVAEEAVVDPSHVELADELQEIIDRAGTPGPTSAEAKVEKLPEGVEELPVSPEITNIQPLEDHETSFSFGGKTVLGGDLVTFREKDGDQNQYQVIGKTVAAEDGGTSRLILLRPSGRVFGVNEPKDGEESPILMVEPPTEPLKEVPDAVDKNGEALTRGSTVKRIDNKGREVTLKVAYTAPYDNSRVIVHNPEDSGFVFDLAASDLNRVADPTPVVTPGPPEGPIRTPQPPEGPTTPPPGPPEGPPGPDDSVIPPPGPPIPTPPGPPEGPTPTDPVDAPPGTKLSQEELDKIMNDTLQVGAIDVSKSQEQRAKQFAQERLIADKAESDAQRQAFRDKHPGIAKHKLGEILLNTLSTARHPIEPVFKQNLFRSATLEKYKYEFLTGDKREDLQLSEDTIRATVARFGEAAEQRKAGNADAFNTLEHAHEKVISEEAPDVIEFKASLIDLIKERVEGGMSEEDFLAAKDRLIVEKAQWMNVRNGKDGEKIVDAADTIAAAAETMIKLYEHTKSMELVDKKLASMQLVTGEARIGARAEMKLTRTERTIEALTRNSVIGRLVPDQTLAIAVAASSSLVARGMSGTASKVAKWGTLGAGAGISAIGVYSRERLALRQERTTVERQMATGDQAKGLNLESTPTREKLSETIFDMNSSEVILSKFREIRESIPAEGIDLTSEQAADIFQQVMETRAMLEWGDAEQRDVIRYTSEDKMDGERTEMDMNLILLTDLLRQHYDDEHAEHRPEGVGSFADMMESQKRLFMESRLEQVQGDLDKKYDSFSKKRAFVKAATTVVAGAAIGALAKEGIEIASEKFGRLAFLQSASERQVRPKALENSTHTGFGVERTYPKDWDIKYDSASHGTIFDSKGNVLSSADFDPKTGAMTAATVEALKEKNIKVNTELITVKGPNTEFHTSVDEFSTHQPKVKRFWQDNNTNAPIFDQNELGTQVRLDGDSIVIDVRGMTPGGSFHGGTFVDAPSEFSSGNGKLLFSLDKNHQSTPFQWNVGTDGTVRLPANSTEARNLFEMQGGRPTLKAAYMEVATGKGITPDGVQQYNVLSTVVGKNNMPDVTVYDIPTEATTSRTIITALDAGSTSRTTDMAFLFLPPPLPRYGLEAIPQASDEENKDQPGQAVQSDSPAGGDGVAVRQPVDGVQSDSVTPTIPGPPTSPEADTAITTPESTNNKAYTAVTEMPIDEAWKRHFEAVAARFETEEAGQDSFWETEATAARQAPEERVRRSAEAAKVLSVVAPASPGFEVDSAELLSRLTSGLESARDMSRLKAELEAQRLVAEADDGKTPEEKAKSLAKVKEAEEALANLEAQKKEQAPDTERLLGELGDEIKHLRSQGMTDLKDIDLRVLGRMIATSKQAGRFSQKDYDWLQTAYDMVEVSRTARLKQKLEDLHKKRDSSPSAKTREKLSVRIDDLEQQLSGVGERYAQKRNRIERYQILARATTQARQALRNTVETETPAPSQSTARTNDDSTDEGVVAPTVSEPEIENPSEPVASGESTEGEVAAPEVEPTVAA